MYKLFLDDDKIYRSPADDSWIRVYSYEEFVSYIQRNGLPEEISFDHDLGNINGVVQKTGKDCANWLVGYCIDNNLKLPKYKAHTANPVGRQNIIGLLDSFKKHQS